MIINLNEDVTSLMMDKITNALNNLKPKEKLYIYLCSTGGDAEVMEAIIHVVNNNADLIELVGYGTIYSAAFDIFFRSGCYKIILPSTVGMCHYSKVSISINENGRPYDKIDYANRMWTKNQKEYTTSFCKEINMSDKEISEIRQGKDVYFQPKRMQELLRTSKQNTDN